VAASAAFPVAEFAPRVEPQPGQNELSAGASRPHFGQSIAKILGIGWLAMEQAAPLTIRKPALYGDSPNRRQDWFAAGGITRNRPFQRKSGHILRKMSHSGS
jgi:hypothetical protein